MGELISVSARLNSYSRFDPITGCINWTASVIRGGYGQIRVNGKMMLAHRASWELRNGPILAGLVLRHTCDNPLCINPSHLIPGTQKQNCEDRNERGRQAKGERQGSAKLTEDQVRKIRADPRGCRRVAREYGINKSYVVRLRNGEFWRHCL